MGSVKTVIGH